ncbi:iron chelate uptake ABC transporter family permease subunit, partial [Cellulomonas septica]|uniref:iron chelate uptake ABC transporter family permease subunit n=1 Tax=Cellulomonas septica TaxID=285080 RepID=UPI0031B64F21
MTDLLSTPVRPADGSDAGVTLDDFRPDWSRVVDPGDDQTLAVLVASRAPRVLAGLLVGAALGVSGGALQSV